MVSLALCLFSTLSVQRPTSHVLLWGGDAEGGAPFVEADPADPSQVRGFDVEVAGRIARGLDRTSRFVQIQWSNIDQSVERGDFTLGLSGVEDTPTRRALHAVTLPYFEFREVLAVRAADTILLVHHTIRAVTQSAFTVCAICAAAASRRWARRSRTTCS